MTDGQCNLLVARSQKRYLLILLRLKKGYRTVLTNARTASISLGDPSQYCNASKEVKSYSMPYVLVRESLLNGSCWVEGLPLNESKVLGKITCAACFFRTNII